MGRYENIKVWDGSSWRTPTQIKVYRSGWQDLGTATSDSTRPLYVYKESEHILKRATLNRRDYTTVVDQYATGRFTLTPASGYCYCTDSSSTTNYKWDLNITIRKTDNVDQWVFQCGTKTKKTDTNITGTTYIKVKWLANGKIEVTGRWKGNTVDTITSSNAVMAGTWATLHIYSNKSDNGKCYIVFNGVSKQGTNNNYFQISDAYTVVGDTKMQFKNTFSVQGCKYRPAAVTCSFNASTASNDGSGSNTYKGVTHYAETQSHTVYE